MARRSKDWNEGLANDLKDLKFAREFLIAALDEGLSLQAALGKVIKAYGVIEFAKKIQMPSSNILRAINPNHNPTQETLSRFLSVFGLKLTVAPLHEGEKRKKRAA